LIESQLELFGERNAEKLPRDFRINHIAATFVETVRWWIDNKMQESPEQITEYFMLVV